jgi:hypothetical protein
MQNAGRNESNKVRLAGPPLREFSHRKRAKIAIDFADRGSECRGAKSIEEQTKDSGFPTH